MKVIVLVIDTLRADHLGCYEYERNTSPHIDEFAKEATVFKNDIAADVPTQPSFTNLMTGMRGITTGVVSHHPPETIDDSLPLLQELMSSKMTTAGVSTLYGMKKYFTKGFHYFMNPVAGAPQRLQLVYAEEVNHYALEWLKEHYREDFYMFIHYWDPHSPYEPPEQYREMFYRGDYRDPNNHSMDALKATPLWQFHKWWVEKVAPGVTDVDYIRALYDGEIRRVDDAFGQLVEELKELKIYDETMLVVTADHGESIYDHGVYFDHADVYQNIIRVPLIIRYPGVFPAKTVDGLVQNIDVTRTVLDIAKVQHPPYEGINLLEVARGEAKPRDTAFSDQAVWTIKRTMIKAEGRHLYKLIVTYDPGFWPVPDREVYDLSSDPKETKNLAESNKRLLDDLELELRRWEDSMLKGRVDPLRKIVEAGLPAKKWVQDVLARQEKATYEELRNKIDAPKPAK
ncbi:MAG: sulfatase [Thermoprotei archaeon]